MSQERTDLVVKNTPSILSWDEWWDRKLVYALLSCTDCLKHFFYDLMLNLAASVIVEHSTDS